MPKVQGGDVAKRRMRIIARNVHKEVVVRLDRSAVDLLSRARGLAPQLEGFLILSAHIIRRGNQHTAKRIIVFDSPYAVVRHEDTYNLGPISSQKSSPDGFIGRKFLSRPFEQHSAFYVNDIGKGVALALRQSVR